MVIKSFKKCGVLYAMDGTEDDMLVDELVCGPEQVPESDQVTDLDSSTVTGDGLQDYYDAGIELSDNAIECLFQSDDEEDECRLHSKRFARMRFWCFDGLSIKAHFQPNVCLMFYFSLPLNS